MSFAGLRAVGACRWAPGLCVVHPLQPDARLPQNVKTSPQLSSSDLVPRTHGTAHSFGEAVDHSPPQLGPWAHVSSWVLGPSAEVRRNSGSRVRLPSTRTWAALLPSPPRHLPRMFGAASSHREDEQRRHLLSPSFAREAGSRDTSNIQPTSPVRFGPSDAVYIAFVSHSLRRGSVPAVHAEHGFPPAAGMTDWGGEPPRQKSYPRPTGASILAPSCPEGRSS